MAKPLKAGKTLLNGVLLLFYHFYFSLLSQTAPFVLLISGWIYREQRVSFGEKKLWTIKGNLGLLISEHDHPGSGRCGLWSLQLIIHSAKELDSLLFSWFDESCILGCTSSKKLSKLLSVWIYFAGAVHLNALNQRPSELCLMYSRWEVQPVGHYPAGSPHHFWSLLKWASKAFQLTPLCLALVRLSHEYAISIYKHLSSTKR